MRAWDDEGSAWAQVEAVSDKGVWICLWPDIPHMRQHIEVSAVEALNLAALLVRAAGYDLK